MMRDERGNEAELLRYLKALRSRVAQPKQAGLKRGAEDTKESDQIFRAIFDNAADGILLVDLESKEFSLANRAICQMLGYGQHELKTLAVGDIHPEEDLPYVTEQFEKQAREELTLARNIPVKRKDGSIFFADINSFPITFGRKTYLMGIFRDITRRKNAEEKLRQSEEKFRLAMEATNDALWDWDMVTNEVYRNPRHATMLGYEPHELTASQEEWEKRIHPDDKALVLRFVDEHLEAKSNSFNVEYRLLTKSGDYIWVLGRGKIVAYGEDGTPERMIGTNVDITERKKAEDEVRKFKAIADRAGYGIAMSDLEGNLTYTNEPFAQMHGYEMEELIGRNLSILHSEEQMDAVNRLNQQLRETGFFVSGEVWHTRKDGTEFCASMNGTLIKDKRGEPQFLACTAMDITERVRAQDAIRRHETRLRHLVSSSPAVIYTCKTSGDYGATFVSENVISLTGYDARDFIENSGFWLDHVHPDDRQNVLDGLSGLFEKGHHRHEYRFLSKEGSYRWMMDELKLLRDERGDPLEIVGSWLDITHRKDVEAALAENEAKYRTLVESSGDAICIIDGRGVFLFANGKATEIVGVEAGELVGKTMWDFFPKEVADRRIAAVRQVLETQQDVDIVRLTELRGRPSWYHTKLLPIKGAYGGTVVMTVSRDVDKIKRAEERIRTLSSAAEQSIDGIAISDLERRLRYVNAAYARMHGYTPEEMTRMSILDLRNKQQADEYERTVHQIETQGSWTGEAEHVREDGTVFPCYLSVTSLKDNQGKTTGRLAVCRDITESKKREEELATYREQMARAEQLASLGTLSATIAHQVTQPLTVIRLSLDNVLDEMEGTSCSSTVLRRLRDSVAQVSNITSIINRFRSFARHSSDTAFGELEVHAVVVRIVRLLAESARQARVTLHVEDMGKLPSAFLNERELEQILFALIENAIQAADGNEARQVVISGAAKDEQIELRFSDDCGGIAPEHLGKVFEPFFTTKPRGRGTGLGLCVVQDAVARVGGRVRVESEFGKGSTFFVVLPVNED